MRQRYSIVGMPSVWVIDSGGNTAQWSGKKRYEREA